MLSLPLPYAVFGDPLRCEYGRLDVGRDGGEREALSVTCRVRLVPGHAAARVVVDAVGKVGIGTDSSCTDDQFEARG